MKFKAFHKISYGIYLVLTQHEDIKAGYIANTVFQVTSEPSCLAISCHKKNYTTQKIIDSGRFSVSALKKDTSTSLMGQFGFMSGGEIDKFSAIKTIESTTGAPVHTESAVAWFDCKVVNSYDLGSHMLIIGEVAESDIVSDEEPLTYAYYREKYRMLSPKHSPTYIEKEKLDKEKEEGDTRETETPAEQPTEPDMSTFTCTVCGFRYDPEEGDPTVGIPPGTPFEDLPEDYKCPICNAGKEYFTKD